MRRATWCVCVMSVALAFGAASASAQGRKMTIEDAPALQEAGAPQ